MDEEKIIDGVDVSECKYYVPYTKDCINDNKSYDKCKSCKDCYYKQLKRLEESHDKLYNDLLEVVKPYLSDFTGYDEKEQCFNIVLAVKELLGQLEQENEELKETIQELNESIQTCNVQRIKLYKENEELKEEYQQAHDDFITSDACLRIANTEKDELKYALKEIDKKLELALDVEQTDAEESFDLLYEIQDIITEAIGE